MKNRLTLLRRSPRSLTLGVLALFVLILVVGEGRTDRAPVERQDSALFQLLSRQPVGLAHLAAIRTPGYPLLLKGTRAVCADLSCLPEVQLLLHGLACLALCAGLLAVGLSPAAALAASVLVTTAPLAGTFIPWVMSDLPGASLGVLAVAALLACLARPCGWTWSALALALALTWLTRPAYLFLVPLLPLAGLWHALVRDGLPAWRRTLRRTLLPLGLASCLPLLLWCTLRFALLGSFAPVSFTGFNLIGLTASWLTEPVVARLPPEPRELAGIILAERQTRGMAPVDATTPYAQWRAQFDTNVWGLSAEAARELGRRELAKRHQPRRVTLLREVEADHRLTGLSLALIRDQPGLYARWLRSGWHLALGRLRSAHLGSWPTRLLLLGALALIARDLLARRRGAASAPLGERRPLLPWPSLGFLALALAYCFVSLALTLALEPPQIRYLDAASILLPGALLAAAIEVWLHLLRPIWARFKAIG
ncbi:MAG TPA: hypothetical protein VF017_14355 [Thermoanaerobaculia bacterium]|nr:hypothetical protein [Thermoanaerobaculia bacterium]